MKTRVPILAVAIFAAALWPAFALAQDTTAITAFTYQGYLESGGAPADGVYDLRFRLYDAATAGNQVGETAEAADIAVSQGLFTVWIDFGLNAFPGANRWLETEVRPGISTGAFTALAPRQLLTPTPYALYAHTSHDARKLGGVDANQYLRIGEGGGVYANRILVAKSGGEFTSIQKAIDSITDNDASHRYLIDVAPGIYQEQVTMKPFIDIQGSGQTVTVISSTGNSDGYSGTVNTANDSELRFLSVENVGGSDYAVAIYAFNASPLLTFVTATAYGSRIANYAIRLRTGANPIIRNVHANVHFNGTGENALGLSCERSSPEVYNSFFEVRGATNTAYGVYGLGDVGTVLTEPFLKDCTINVYGASRNYGVWMRVNSIVTLRDCAVTASRSATRVAVEALGVGLEESGASLVNCFITALNGNTNYGIYHEHSWSVSNTTTFVVRGANQVAYAIFNLADTGAYNVELINSRLLCDPARNRQNEYTLWSDREFRVFSAMTQFAHGGIAMNQGQIICIGCYNENYQNSGGYTAVPY